MNDDYHTHIRQVPGTNLGEGTCVSIGFQSNPEKVSLTHSLPLTIPIHEEYHLLGCDAV
jgi:hypothetical protein